MEQSKEKRKILLTGASGYIGKRLLPILVDQGYYVYCLVRDKRRFNVDPNYANSVEAVQADLLDKESMLALPKDIDAAYFLVHSMTSSEKDFDALEYRIAENFKEYIKATQSRQIIYLSGLSNDAQLSKHLASRKKVEEILEASGVPVTVLRAGIIIGSGSASFEIIRDLVEKLLVMIAPKWLNSKIQPIAIDNVLDYLTGVLFNEATYSRKFDIGGPDQLTYKEMLMQFAEVRGYKRLIITVPVLTPRLSSRWLIFVTSTSYNLAKNLVDSLKNDAICQENTIHAIIDIQLITYRDAVEKAFTKIEQNSVVSSWTDAIQSDKMNKKISSSIRVPTYGCFKDSRTVRFDGSPEKVIDKIWSIGGKNGWYFADGLWKIRGLMDKLIGGVGLRRGRRDPKELNVGDALDFWRVLLADKEAGRLLLYAEMKLPGEAWLEFEVIPNGNNDVLKQTATFRPRGIAGRLYWYAVLPFHHLIFEGMASRIVNVAPDQTV